MDHTKIHLMICKERGVIHMSVTTIISMIQNIADNFGDWISAKKELQAIADSVHELSESIDKVLDEMDDEMDDD